MLGIGMMIMSFYKIHFGPVLIILELIIGISFGFYFGRVLLLPLDFLCGKKSEEVYFSRLRDVSSYEFFTKKYFCEWKFYSSKGTLAVVVPVAYTEAEVRNMNKPLVDQKVRICYYKYSKILYSAELLERDKGKKRKYACSEYDKSKRKYIFHVKQEGEIG